MNCPICYTDDWENVDRFRLKPHNMCMCRTCAFISYPDKYKTEEEIKAHYRDGYRTAPTANNLYTGERKLWYHDHFLRPLIEAWKENKVRPVIGEVGSAMGMFLKWMEEQIDCETYGTELTTTFKRVAHHAFGIDLQDDLDWSKKYDMIATYHVLEHMMDPDKQLKKYCDALTPNGVIYLSCPVWFREATNFGSAGFSLEYYYADDHINVWSEEHLEYMIARAGLEPVFKNDDVYGNVYLLKKATKPIELPDPKTYDWGRPKLVDTCERILKCWRIIQEAQGPKDSALAIEAYPNCPHAWSQHYEMNRANFDKNKEELDNFLTMAVAACPNTSDSFTLAGDVMSRYERYDDSLKFFEKALAKKPNNPTILLAIGNCYRQKAIREKSEPNKIELFKAALSYTQRVRDTSLEKNGESTTFMYSDMAHIPIVED